MAKSRTHTAKANRIKTLLKNTGHRAGKVDQLDLSTPKRMAEAVARVHELTMDDLRRALS